MAGDNLPTIWPLEPHTRAKHDLLVRYIGGWYPILSKFSRRVVFLDAFAGPGVYAGGEAGSPRKALETLLDHHYLNSMSNTEFLFIFNERDGQRFASLERTVKDVEASRGGLPKNIKVILENTEFTTLAKDILDGLDGKNLAPTFAFLDPFGYKDVPMDVIKNLLSYDKCELFIYFDFNSVNRFASAGVVDGRFEALFGTDEFKKAPPSGPARKAFLHDLYQEQLSEICGFDYVQSFEMVNKKNRTGNYLFFCTRNLKGLANMKEAMWKVAPGGDYRYSDLLADQMVFFEDNVDTTLLQDELAKQFAGKTVTISQVEDYAIARTPYAKSHVRRKTLAPMQRDGRITSPNQKKKGTFPDGTLIQFP